MSILVTEEGFSKSEPIAFVPADALTKQGTKALAVDLPNDADAETVSAHFDRISMIRIPFPTFSDGRGFSLARRLRDLGFSGRLRANGHLISDQFAHARLCGFDEVEIDEMLAERQPETLWRTAISGRPSYSRKLNGDALAATPIAKAAADAPVATPVATEKPTQIPANVYAETVTEVTHYTNDLFRFRTTRPQSFRFRSGEFVMIGLPGGEKPLFRAYSIASPSWDEALEFFSIKVPNGPLTSRLQKIRPGDTLLLRKKSTGTLVTDALLPGKTLYLFSTGTGIAPFASIIRDPDTYEKFERVVLTYTCRTVAELKYGLDLVEGIYKDPILGELITPDNLTLYASATREAYERQGRITTLIESGRLYEELGLPPLNPDTDRAMICGSMAMLKDVKVLCEKAGLEEGANNRPATFVVERAYVD